MYANFIYAYLFIPYYFTPYIYKLCELYLCDFSLLAYSHKYSARINNQLYGIIVLEFFFVNAQNEYRKRRNFRCKKISRFMDWAHNF